MRRLILPCALALTIPACKGEDTSGKAESPPAAEAGADPAPPPAAGKGDADTASTPFAEAVAWLDPEAVGAVWTSGGSAPVATLAPLYALPARTAKLLTADESLDDTLELLSDDHKVPAWAQGPTLTFRPLVASGLYLVRRVNPDRAARQEALKAAGFVSSEQEGFTLWAPQRGSFAYRIVELTDSVLGFVPLTAVGGGLAPLTAGRDMPAGEVERGLTEALKNNPATRIELVDRGPLIHLDFDPKVLAVQMSIRPEKDGLDGVVRMTLGEGAPDAVKALDAREPMLGTDAADAVAKRVAFTLDGPAVEARLQLTAADLETLAGA